jgi:DNA-binding GntR family transcriptional regulator
MDEDADIESRVGKTLSQTIADQLAEEIVMNRIPPGTRLDEQSIAQRFGVSRSPVRDALRQLATTRVVVNQPRRGFSVSKVEPNDLDGLFEASGEVEALCARLCALRAGPTERLRIQFVHEQASEAIQRQDAKAYSAFNEEFHALIYTGCHNRTLEDVAVGLRQRLAPFRSRGFFVVDNRLQSSHVEHEALVQAILAQDGDAAARAMHKHAANSAMNVMQHFGRGSAEPALVRAA